MIAALTFEVLDHAAAFGLSQGSCDPTQAGHSALGCCSDTIKACPAFRLSSQLYRQQSPERLQV